MGAWIALRMAQELRRAGEDERVAGLVLLAPAPDFTAELVEPALTQAQQARPGRTGLSSRSRPTIRAEPNVYTRALIEDGRRQPRA